MRGSAVKFRLILIGPAAVEIDAGVRVFLVQDLAALAREILVFAHIVKTRVPVFFRVEPHGAHPGAALVAPAGVIVEHDIVEQTVDARIAIADLARERINVLCIAAVVQAEIRPGALRARVVRRGVRIDVHNGIAAVLPPGTPFGVLLCVKGGPSRRDVDGGFHADLVGGVQHFSQQVKVEVRMHRPDLCRVIAHAVVAFGKHGDAGKVAELQSFLKVFVAELRADSLHER